GQADGGPDLGSTTRVCLNTLEPSVTRSRRHHVKKIIGKPCAGKPHARIGSGMGKQGSENPAFLSTNDHNDAACKLVASVAFVLTTGTRRTARRNDKLAGSTCTSRMFSTRSIR